MMGRYKKVETATRFIDRSRSTSSHTYEQSRSTVEDIVDLAFVYVFLSSLDLPCRCYVAAAMRHSIELLGSNHLLTDHQSSAGGFCVEIVDDRFSSLEEIEALEKAH
jgi:hypothetical protein